MEFYPKPEWVAAVQESWGAIYPDIRRGIETQIMFPHLLDRYLMMAYIVKQLRKSLALSQEQLGKRIGGYQGTISNLENPKHLATSAANGQRPISLEVFIKVTLEGLRLSKPESDALVWLIEPDQFKAKGAQSVSNSFLPIESATELGPHALRNGVLELLERAVTIATEKEGEERRVRMLTGWEEEHQVIFRQKLLEMENGPGQRLLVSKYPSHLTAQSNVFAHTNPLDNNPLSERGRHAIEKLTTKRRHRFRQNVKHYGERCIHSTESLKRYVLKDFNHLLTWEDRLAHVRSLIDILDNFPLFEIALASSEPEMEFVIKCGRAASLRGTARELPRILDSVICGPLYIFWDDPTTVYSFVVDFERAWDRIPEEQRDRKYVTAKLEGLLA